MPMTKQQAQDFVTRWAAVRQVEIEELRATPMDEKVRQLNDLMLCARDWPWTPEHLAAESAEVEEVRARWVRLRKAYGV